MGLASKPHSCRLKCAPCRKMRQKIWERRNLIRGDNNVGVMASSEVQIHFMYSIWRQLNKIHTELEEKKGRAQN